MLHAPLLSTTAGTHAMRIALTGRIFRQPILKALAGIQDAEVVELDSVALVADDVPRADAIILSDPRGPEGALLADALRHQGAKTRWVQIISAGYSGMLSHTLPENLVVTNQGGAIAPAVAEHALALILAHYRRLPLAFSAQADARWDNDAIRTGLRTLDGSTVAILGLGHVGQALAARLNPFGATLIGVTRDGVSRAGSNKTIPIAELDQALGLADVVALCLPDSRETRGLFDARRFAVMKPGAFIVNVGRGELIDSNALNDALVAGRLGGAALDVTDPEPLPANHPLWRAPNLIVTPHVAGGGNPNSGDRVAQIIADNVMRFMRAEPLLNQVYPKART